MVYLKLIEISQINGLSQIKKDTRAKCPFFLHVYVVIQISFVDFFFSINGLCAYWKLIEYICVDIFLKFLFWSIDLFAHQSSFQSMVHRPVGVPEIISDCLWSQLFS